MHGHGNQNQPETKGRQFYVNLINGSSHFRCQKFDPIINNSSLTGIFDNIAKRVKFQPTHKMIEELILATHFIDALPHFC